MTTTVYIAGPMTGLPDHNYPAFYAAESLLTTYGYRVLNPARNGTIVGGNAWAAYMRLGLAQVLEVDAVALLPGWESSRGARLEREVALALGLRVASLAEYLAPGNCDRGCWTERNCPTCGLRVPPRGCSIPLEASGSYCECECTLAENDRHLWDVHDSNRAYTDPDGWIAHVNSCDRCEGAPWPCHADVLLETAGLGNLTVSSGHADTNGGMS